MKKIMMSSYIKHFEVVALEFIFCVHIHIVIPLYHSFYEFDVPRTCICICARVYAS